MTTGTKTPIDPGLIARVAAGVRYAFTGNAPVWFGPQQPLLPMVPEAEKESVAGRQFDYPVGVNQRTRPRTDEPVSFEQMRGLADGYDLLRLVIETRKDQVAKLKWQIKTKDDKKQPDARCESITQFLACPDQEHTWDDWLRMLLEDLFVLDAPAIYPRMTNGGQLYALEPIDGSTIKRVIDAHGRTPLPPEPAYQQILKGIPAVDYSRDELIYKPRNPRTHKVYGYSPVEQIIMTVNIALRRQLNQLSYYTEGNTPNLVFGVPDNWNPDQIRQFQDWWDVLCSGETKHKARFVPGGVTPHDTKAGALKDEFDEWLARVVCFAFSINPTPFIKQQNRATADNAHTQALEEGLAPVMAWIKSLIDLVIVRYFGAADLEFAWAEEEAQNPLEQAQVAQIYVTAKVLHPDEVRADLGRPPLTPEQKEELNPPPPPMLAMTSDDPEDEPPEPEPPKDKEAVAKAKKAAPALTPIDRERAAIKREQGKLNKTVAAFLSEQGKNIAQQVIAARESVGKMSTEDLDKVKRIMELLDFQGWAALAGDVQEILEAITEDGAVQALAQVGIAGATGAELTEAQLAEYDAMLSQVNQKAVEYAQARSAELVGMKWVDGELVENPNAAWCISESTRDMIQSDVARAIEEGMSNDDLAALLEENYSFSPERAEMIARTETAFADVAGNMAGYRESGVVESKRWIVGGDCCDLCQEMDGVVVGLDEDFPNGGGDGPPLHPNCRCDVSPVVTEQDNQEQDE